MQGQCQQRAESVQGDAVDLRAGQRIGGQRIGPGCNLGRFPWSALGDFLTDEFTTSGALGSLTYPRSHLVSDEEPGFYHASRHYTLASCVLRKQAVLVPGQGEMILRERPSWNEI